MQLSPEDREIIEAGDDFALLLSTKGYVRLISLLEDWEQQSKANFQEEVSKNGFTKLASYLGMVFTERTKLVTTIKETIQDALKHKTEFLESLKRDPQFIYEATHMEEIDVNDFPTVR